MAKSDTQMRSLFESVEPHAGTDAPRPSSSSKLARSFVRWCCSFGEEFRNSPDEGNLRAWAGQEGFRCKSDQEKQILTSARELYLKRIVSTLSKTRGEDVAPEPPLAN